MSDKPSERAMRAAKEVAKTVAIAVAQKRGAQVHEVAQAIDRAAGLAELEAQLKQAKADRDAFYAATERLVARAEQAEKRGDHLAELVETAEHAALARAEQAEASAQAQHDAYEREREEFRIRAEQAEARVAELEGEVMKWLCRWFGHLWALDDDECDYCVRCGHVVFWVQP